MFESSQQERGASAVEYALLLTGIAAVILLAVFALGSITKEMFTDTCDNVQAEMAGSTTCDS